MEQIKGKKCRKSNEVKKKESIVGRIRHGGLNATVWSSLYRA